MYLLYFVNLSMTETDPMDNIEQKIITDKLNWYALYTRPRYEKKVETQLVEKEIEVYLPLLTVIRQWSDRKKKVEEPLFRGYIFVHTAPDKRIHSLKVDGVVKMIGFGGKPSVIPDDQIEAIRCLLEGGAKLEKFDYFQTGDDVKVVHGPFAGLTGRLIEKRNQRRFVINIDAIRQSVALEIDPGFLAKIESN